VFSIYAQRIHKKLELFAEFTRPVRSPELLLLSFSRIRLAVLAVACAVASPVRPAYADVPTGQTIDGIRCDRSEGAVFHIHQHLTILDRGTATAVPSDVGRPLLSQCLYWIHTHTPDGIIHVESPVMRTFTLGNFFDIWGQPLSSTAVGPLRLKKGALHAFLDGHPYSGDPRKIELTLHADFVLEAGPPYSVPAAFTDWQGN